MFNLQEAFSKLNMMESGDFDLLNQEEKDAMKEFLEDDSVEAVDVDIIDPLAEDESELEDSYIGKIIVQCPVCRSLIYKTQEQLDEEGEEPQTCPYCFSVENFELVGKIVPVEDETAPEVVEEEPIDAAPAEEPAVEVSVEESVEEDKCPECGENPCVCEKCECNECGDAELTEDLENVTIETEDQVINISAEDKEECPECGDADLADIPAEEVPEEEHEVAEVIAPLEDSLPDEPEAASEEMDEEPVDEEDGIDIDDVDEESFDEFAESLLREKYSNIVSYKTTKMKDGGNCIITEGIVTLKDGKKKLTEFRIRPSKFSRNGKGACLVENLQLKTRKVARAYVSK